MTLRFCALASGSRGNALLVEHDDTLIMIDCGLPLKVLEERFAAVGRDIDELDAVLITHEHGDHSRGIGPLQRSRELEFRATPGTAQAVDAIGPGARIRIDRELSIGSIRVAPYPVPHDAREPCQFVFHAGQRKLGVLSDAGHATPVMRQALAGCDALAIEFNHDCGMLENGSYPESVKARVGSRFGHLSNDQAADLLAELAHPGLQSVMALHLSERNNASGLVQQAAARATDNARIEFRMAAQNEASAWVEIA